MNLKKYGDWALITGASSGIGEAFAYKLAEEGLKLILLARREDRLQSISTNLKKKFNTEVLFIELDLSREDFLTEMIEKIQNREVGILINNAGKGSSGFFNDIDPKHEIEMVKLNCLAPTILTHHFVRPMVERNKGAIIFLGSNVAYQPSPYMATYSATKAFNLFMGNSLWQELKKYNIDVLALNPGSTETEFQRIANVNSVPFVRKADHVVNSALKALGKKPSVVDGWLNKIGASLVKLFTKKQQVQIVGSITKRLLNNKNN